MQTTVGLFTIIQYIKDHELTSAQLDSLIAELIEYKSTVDNIGEQNYLEEEAMKLDNILNS